MAKIPFDIKFKPQIESGEYKVETRDGLPVRVLCFDAEGRFPVVAMVNSFPASMYTKCGCAMNNEGHGKYDLFIVTPEPELSEFEIRLLDWLSDDTSGEIPMERMKEVVRNRAAELLSIACEQQKEQKSAEKLSKEEYVKRFKALCDAYEIKLPNREYDVYHLCDDLSKLSIDSGKQTPEEWGEEDRKMIQSIITNGCVDDKQERWLRMLPEPKQEWSEEDEIMLRKCISATFDHGYLRECDWLKSLRSQPHWKPSASQLQAIRTAIAVLTEERSFPKAAIKLESLYSDLQKHFNL